MKCFLLFSIYNIENGNEKKTAKSAFFFIVTKCMYVCSFSKLHNKYKTTTIQKWHKKIGIEWKWKQKVRREENKYKEIFIMP